ncbi:MAG: enoyl-CoA hydratase/isomerase family protein [Acidimicrobiales bacterium]|nr:enoyl-CoA hydratase/isomerase family protein [Acidimicrobiales bacterium]
MSLKRVEDICVLDFGDDENRLSPQWLDAIDEALDAVAAEAAPLVTVGSGRFYSNGLDLEWLGANPGEMEPYVARVHGLFARFLTLGVPTVAAINGHAFGAGAMIAMAHDWRVMRSDRGYFCFPEVDIHIPFTAGMAALIQAKLTPRAAVDAMTTGRRFSGPDALGSGLVDAVANEDELIDAAKGYVADLVGKDAKTLGAIKSVMYADVVEALGATSA